MCLEAFAYGSHLTMTCSFNVSLSSVFVKQVFSPAAYLH